ncbi:hypothetical protein [Streptomyces melanogenes]|uniref:hypothetical protein n=1 Tax=Streptomyces melanogenes TaxID=67326 RepID=UPI00167D42C8|nr:hypothetical protein [Streptomyces melanogenes]GGP92311.1 hypothetical protein GCM10010278_83060 [Streptomyces melanogenes]
MSVCDSTLIKSMGLVLLTGLLTLGNVSVAAAHTQPESQDDGTRNVTRSNWNGFPLTDGPGAAKIVQKFSLTFPIDTGLREGNANFGRVHIAKGGKKGNKYNHEMTSYAKSLWVKAMENEEKGSQSYPFKGGTFSTYKYKIAGGTKRTMCILVDRNEFTYAGNKYGHKGIITAYWVNGHISSGECSGKD